MAKFINIKFLKYPYPNMKLLNTGFIRVVVTHVIKIMKEDYLLELTGKDLVLVLML